MDAKLKINLQSKVLAFENKDNEVMFQVSMIELPNQPGQNTAPRFRSDLKETDEFDIFDFLTSIFGSLEIYN